MATAGSITKSNRITCRPFLSCKSRYNSCNVRVAPSVYCAAFQSSRAGTEFDRRHILLGGALTLLSLRITDSAEAANYRSELCSYQDTEEEADECRRRAIEKDSGKSESYSAAAGRQGDLGKVDGVPVAVLDSEYVKSSEALMELLEQYCTLEPADKARIALAKKIKTDGLAWVSKYARGGSARSQSARRLYIAVDGVIGFLASNGLAPYPKAKVKTTLTTIEQARALFAIGK